MSDTTELVDLAVIFPDLEIELKYACADNITGKAIYQQARCLLHKDAITALAKSISIAQLSGLQLVIYDAYRPQQAQAMLWQACPDPQYVVDVTVGSNHSRGTAIDLTLRDEHGNILDMGAGFDEMHERSHAYQAVKLSKIRPGQWIAIYGLGGLGNLALQYAKNVFNAKVIAIDVNDEQLKLATEMGADLAINSRTEDAAKIVQEKTGGAHSAVVTAVAKAAFNSAVDAVRAGGRVVAVGLPPESMSLDIPRLVLDGIEVVGSLVGTRQDLTEAFQFAAEGKVVPKVALRPLADINTIFTEMEEGKVRGRMVIDFRH